MQAGVLADLPDLPASHGVLATGCGILWRNSNKIERLMRAQALRARPRRRALPKDDGERSASTISPNVLDRQFTADQPNRKWIADFTYVWTAEGWLYVAAVIDLFFVLRRRLVDEGRDERATRHRRVVNGDLAARAPGCAVASLRQSEDKRQFPGGPALIAMDQPVRLAPRGALCGLTHTQIDQPCLSPDLSTARERLAVRLCLADAAGRPRRTGIRNLPSAKPPSSSAPRDNSRDEGGWSAACQRGYGVSFQAWQAAWSARAPAAPSVSEAVEMESIDGPCRRRFKNPEHQTFYRALMGA